MPEGARVTLRGSVQGMQSSFKSFGIGLILSVVLVYLVLVAQFASWTDPVIILLAVPPGLAGVLLFLLATKTTLNVMSLMGRGDDGGHCCFEQHFDCGIRETFASRRKAVEGSSVGGIAVAAEAGTDDFAGHAVGLDSDGDGN